MDTPALYVGTVVRRGDQVLLVRQSPGHPLERQWTVPWGSVAPGESAARAAVRETYEEAGITAAVTALIGVQELPPPQDGGIAIIYACEHLSGNPEPKDKETDRAVYFSLSEFESLDEPIEPWSRWLVRRVFNGDVTGIRSRSDNPLQVHGAYV